MALLFQLFLLVAVLLVQLASVNHLPPPTAAAIVADYQAMYAQSHWEGPPKDSGEYTSFLARIVRTNGQSYASSSYGGF
jgi:hypothetical protein